MVDDRKLSEVLVEFARTMVTDFPIQGILDHLVERIVEVLPVDGAGVTLITETRRPEYVAASNAAALRFEQLQTELAEGPCLEAYETGCAVSVPDLADDDRFSTFAPAAADAGLGAVFTFPLRHAEQQIGALDVYRHEAGALDADDMSAAQTLADVTSAYLWNARKRDEAKAAADHFEHVSLHDPLTGLANRQLLHERIRHAEDRAKRAHTDAAVLFIDLDRFKDVNDSFGHHLGDALLVAVADRLRHLVRVEDTLARVSGDEFVVFCEEISAPRDADQLASRIRSSLGEPFILLGQTIRVTASVGVAYVGPGESVDANLLIKADLAMYEVKRRGRLDDPAAKKSTACAAERSLERELHVALDEGLLDVAYQPIVSTTDRTVVGVETLLRWDHATRGLVDPAAVIATAERSRLIDRIGEWVLRRACDDHRRWMDTGAPEPLDLFVNVSVRQLLQPRFTTVVADALNASGMTSSSLVLEVTEGVFIDKNERVFNVLDTLDRIGVRIALDDYGTGFSSLSYLTDLSLHTIKIDGGFVAELSNEKGRIIVESVSNLAHALGFDVIAEGVETDWQHDIVRMLGCDRAQGFLYGEPMDGSEVADFLKGERSAPLDDRLAGTSSR